MNIHHRVAAIADLAILLELVQEFHKNEKLPFDKNIDSDVLKHFLADESLGKAYLVHQEDKVIGYIILTLGYSLEYRGRDAFIDEFYIHPTHQRKWNLYLIVVHPHHQRQGCGKSLLQHVEQILAKRGERVLLVETSETENFEYVRAFYRKNGYEEEARIREFYTAGVDKIIFRKVLN